jgi:hypothetical protein
LRAPAHDGVAADGPDPGDRLQLVNPKIWIFAVSAVSTFRPTDVPVALGSLLVVLTMMAIAVPTAALWVVAGDLLSRLIERPRTRRAFSLGLALLVVATVVLVWTAGPAASDLDAFSESAPMLDRPGAGETRQRISGRGRSPGMSGPRR